MLKKQKLFFSFIAGLIAISVHAQEQSEISKKATESDLNTPSENAQKIKNSKKYNIMERDQIDPTSTYAIPFDDSEVEDQLEINAAEKRRVFKVPQN